MDPTQRQDTGCADPDAPSATTSKELHERSPTTETSQPGGPTSGPMESIEVALESVPLSQRPYSIFGTRKKMSIVLIATLGGLFSPFTTNIYFPAISQIANSLHTSVSDVDLTITTYMIIQGIAPSFISPIADYRGRRLAYVIGFAFYVAANLGLSFNNSYVGLLLLRMLQSAGSSGLTTLQQGTIADIITSAERGRYIGITSISGVVAPSVAPIVGGALAEGLGWHWIFIFLLILSAVYMIPLLLFFPETNRRIVGDGSVTPPKSNWPWWDLMETVVRRGHCGSKDNENLDSLAAPLKKLRWSDPFQPILLLGDRQTAIILGVNGLCYAAFYCISSSLSVQFGRIYHVSETIQGLLFLPQAVGSALAALTNSYMLDWNFRRHARRLGMEADRKTQQDISSMPIEKMRLEIGGPMFALGAVFMIVYGWLLDVEVSIAGPIVLLVFIGYTTLAGFNAVSVLIIDLYRKKAASASAANNLVRCLLGAGATAVINPMINGMGLGWAFTLVGLIQLAVSPLLILPAKYGMEWRAQDVQKRAAKKPAKEAEKEAVQEATSE